MWVTCWCGAPARLPSTPVGPAPLQLPAPRCWVQGGDVTRRRRAVCAHLGLGDCDGRQLLRQLNRYGFSLQEVEQALLWANEQGAGGGGGASDSSGAPGAPDTSSSSSRAVG